MTKISKFQSLYDQDTELQSILQKQESLRKSIVNKSYKTAVVVLIVAVLIALMLYRIEMRFDNGVFGLGVVLLLIVPIVFYFLYQNTRDNVSKIYKNEVMPLLVNHLLDKYRKTDNDEIKYQSSCWAGVGSYQTNPLFDYGNKVDAEDLITGKIDKTQFSFYEAHYYIHTEHSSTYLGLHHTGPDLNLKHNSDRFRGLVFSADFNKDFQSVTTVSCGKPARLSIPEKNIDLQLVNLEAGPFSDLFDVYSTDQQNARYILSSALMERMVQLNQSAKKFCNKNMSVIFRGSIMEIFLPSTVDRFEASVFTEMKPEDVSTDFDVLDSLLSLIDEMKLNVRIWNKE